MSKKVLCTVLSFVLIASAIYLPTQAESFNYNADRLKSLSLFKGTDTGYNLTGTATRIHGIIMLIRLLGEDDEALIYQGASPFTDINNDLYNRYAAYAHSKGYTSGTSSTTFSPDTPLSFKDYVTFLLRALGYDDKKGDFSYNECFYKAGSINLIENNSAYVLANSTPVFYRADMVDLSVSALTTPMNNSSSSLAHFLMEKDVFNKQSANNANILSGQEPFVFTNRDYSSTVSRITETYFLPSGKVTCDVITVNLKNPAVRLETRLSNNTIGSSLPFSQIVASSNAEVIVNGNFFEAYAPIWYPVGHVMSNGEFMYGVSGMESFGFTPDGEVKVGSPSLFFNVKGGGSVWSCYELNSATQTPDYSVLYTPAYGNEITTKCNALIATVQSSYITNVQRFPSGSTVYIPSDGYIMFFGENYASTSYFSPPRVGTPVTMTPELFVADEEGFTMDNVTNIVSGGPRLVKNGEIYTYLKDFYKEARFTTTATTRTAIGTQKDGKLVIISTSKATIQQLRELMHHLGCINAFNLDGGASTAFSYQGKIIRAPGRNLTTTLHIFVEN